MGACDIQMKNKQMYGLPISLMLFQIILLLLITLLIIFLLSASKIVYLNVSIIFFLILISYIFIYKNSRKFIRDRKRVLDLMIQSAKLSGDENILDIGTGAGYIAIGFAKKLQNGVVHGIDKYGQKNTDIITSIIESIKINFFGNTLENAKNNAILEKQENKIYFVAADLTKSFPFASQTFDVIVSSQFLYCIHHDKLEMVLSEINRVLKMNGKIIFFESNQFMKWDMKNIIKFFKTKQYEINILNIDVFQNKSILVGTKKINT
jgi:ubiquinone/menaquinone biosynthesis C-methylase UbiE